MRDLSREQNPKQKGTLPSDTIANPKGSGSGSTSHCMAITTRSGKLSVNIPFVEAFQEMPGFAKYLKDLITKNRTTKNEVVNVTHRVSSIIATTTVQKKEDPGVFTTPCTIGARDFARALGDNGASINLIPLTIYKQVGLGSRGLQVEQLLNVLKEHRQAIGWTIADIRGIPVGIYEHKIQLENEIKPSVEHQRRLNPSMHEMVKKEIIKWLDVGVVYPIADSSWREGHSTASWMDTPATTKSILHWKIRKRQHSLVHTFSRMPFGLCNAPATFQRFMMSIFSDMLEDFLEVIVYTDHVALRYLMAKKDAKRRLIRWVPLLLEFDFEVKDRKGTENQVADHLSRLEEAGRPKENLEINDAFPDEHILALSNIFAPWYADIANFLISDLIPKGLEAY
ncbi:uncharacterized protein [Nicotiana sylvestris]|uniref:uncharacterized protein n=1 Tax=Nicotiana sylvestris TaxID=4096 RepID=UPI00388CD8F5